MAKLEGGWSTWALNFIDNFPQGENVYRFYLWHITNHGTGWKKDKGVGKVTWNEVCKKLIRYGFPNPDYPVFRMGFDNTHATKLALGNLLYRWRVASKSERKSLIDNLTYCYAD